MFILIVSRGVPTPRDPQWGCFERDQAEALRDAGHQVVVVSVDSRFRCYWRRLGITQAIINGIVYFNSFFIPAAIVKLFGGEKLNCCVRTFQLERLYNVVTSKYGVPEIIYSHYLANSYMAVQLMRKFDIPVVGIEHWSKLNVNVLSSDVRFMGNAVYKKLDGLISVADSLRQRILQHFGIDSVVIHNLVGGEFWNNVETKFLHTKENKVVRFVSVGSLIYIKAYDVLINALAQARLPEKTWHMTIVGGGKLQGKLASLIKKKGLENEVFLVGRKSKREISSILNESDVFVMPSRSENFPVALLEGLSAGLPVIATRCGGVAECVNSSNGLLVPVENVDALAEAIRVMSHSYTSYDRKAIAEDCRRRFSPQAIARQLTDVFEKVLAKRRSNPSKSSNVAKG